MGNPAVAFIWESFRYYTPRCPPYASETCFISQDGHHTCNVVFTFFNEFWRTPLSDTWHIHWLDQFSPIDIICGFVQATSYPKNLNIRFRFLSQFVLAEENNSGYSGEVDVGHSAQAASFRSLSVNFHNNEFSRSKITYLCDCPQPITLLPFPIFLTVAVSASPIDVSTLWVCFDHIPLWCQS